MKLLRVLGKRGRVTIPYPICQRVGFQFNDVLSFTAYDNGVFIRREQLCDGCVDNQEVISLTDYLDSMTKEEQQAALVYLSKKYMGGMT